MFKIAQGASFLVVRIAHLREGLVLDILGRVLINRPAMSAFGQTGH
jgi:hypothetical protein